MILTSWKGLCLKTCFRYHNYSTIDITHIIFNAPDSGIYHWLKFLLNEDLAIFEFNEEPAPKHPRQLPKDGHLFILVSSRACSLLFSCNFGSLSDVFKDITLQC